MPVDVIVEPVKLGAIDSKSIKFEVKPQIAELLSKKDSPYRVEVRGIKLCDIPFKNAWPNFGEMALNGSDWNHSLTLPEREQSRKRKDEPFDLTPYFKKSRKSHMLTLIKKKHPPKQEKNEDRYQYAIGVFLIQKLEISQIIEYHKKYELESFLSTYNMICERLFPKQNEDDIHVISDELKIPMR